METAVDRQYPAPASYEIGELIDYVVCPALAVIARGTGQKPVKRILSERMRLVLNDLTIRSLDRVGFRNEDIARSVGRMFEDLRHDGAETDREYVLSAFSNLSHLLAMDELVVTGSVMPFDLSYGGTILRSSVDFVVYDPSRGLKFPVVVDFSKTRYEPFYNPVVYRCQTVADNMKVLGTNTRVAVLSPHSGKRWEYDERKYHHLIRASITEMLEAMRLDLYPARFSWLCAGCAYRGICHKLVVKKRRYS